MIRRGSRQSIALALALPLAAVAWPMPLSVRPSHRSIPGRRGGDLARRALAEQYRAIAGESVVCARALNTLRDDPWMQSAFFGGENSAIVAATLQQQAKAFVQEFRRYAAEHANPPGHG